MDKFTILSIAAAAVLVLVVVVLIVFRKKPRKIKNDEFQEKWKDLQKLCRNKDTWGEAVLKADKLLDSALKKLRYKGKSMGERIVAAQKVLTDNDGVWFGHKLAKKIQAGEVDKLKEADVKDALMGLGQALRDLGVLKR
jgi:hypothetical protein